MFVQIAHARRTYPFLRAKYRQIIFNTNHVIYMLKARDAFHFHSQLAMFFFSFSFSAFELPLVMVITSIIF